MSTVGTDKIEEVDDRFLIHATYEMDWPVREFCRIPIHYRDQRYYLASRRKGVEPYAVVYELHPWPADLHESSEQAVFYDESYVAERNRSARLERTHYLVYLILLPLYPVLGLLWSRPKYEWLSQVGFEPESITKTSVIFMLNAAVAEAVFVGWLGGGLLTYFLGNASLVIVDKSIMLLASLDTVFRFSQLIEVQHGPLWGFIEWAWPHRRPPS